MTNKLDFSLAKVLVFGDVMLDEYWHGESHRISPEAPVPVINMESKEFRLGGAANVAINLKSLGAQVTLVSSVGDDQDSIVIENLLDEANIKPIFNKVNKAISTKKLRLISNSQQLMRVDFESKPEVHNPGKYDSYKHLITQADIIVVSDYAKGFIYDPQALIKIIKKANKKVIVDPKKYDLSSYFGASVLTPNVLEFKKMTGEFKDQDDFNKKAFKLVDDINLDALLITRGSEGMTLYKNKEMFHEATTSKEVYDVTGAGDTVVAAFSACLAIGMSYEDSMNFANKCASIVVSKFGTSTVCQDEIKP
tara:strand:+ start:8396 stop:9319 length:924 start_codon:yes stop_codon:yes gene_type:complete